MAYSSKAIANYFLDLGEEEGVEISPMKLQKLVYFAHGWHLGVTGTPLVHEQVECWEYGPVLESIFHEFKTLGTEPIKLRAVSIFPVAESGEEFPTEFQTEIVQLKGEEEDVKITKRFLKTIWNVYKGYSAAKLSNMTHSADGPWDKVYRKYHGDPPKGTDIPIDIIREHFECLLKEDC